ncbi:hypothetical protein [Vibrio sp. EA2]|uniref:hypothetical protein n=1 Tax=Vibrio sp. EA2 TaxID=3079860 RepID=UPI00294A5EB2|nr:hypothetical protein [Vibrio sp. EA2]MDV6250386.1 hypothetical protein [Vibrio sp. EA2]
MNDVLSRMWSHNHAPWIFKLGCLLLITLLLLVIQFPRAELPPVNSFNQLSCSELGQNYQAVSDQEQLDVLIPAHALALPLLAKLCNNAVFSSAYSDIVAHWVPRQQVTPQIIYSQKFDVMWSREYQLAGLSPDYGNYYDKLLSLSGYDVLWYANQAINESFLKTHRIGLLNDTFSRSGYQLPVKQLTSLSIDVSSSQVTLYPTRKAMIEAFIQGEVDVIAGTNYSPINQSEISLHKATIASGVSAGGWFISRSMESFSDKTFRERLTQALGEIG